MLEFSISVDWLNAFRFSIIVSYHFHPELNKYLFFYVLITTVKSISATT